MNQLRAATIVRRHRRVVILVVGGKVYGSRYSQLECTFWWQDELCDVQWYHQSDTWSYKPICSQWVYD